MNYATEYHGRETVNIFKSDQLEILPGKLSIENTFPSFVHYDGSCIVLINGVCIYVGLQIAVLVGTPMVCSIDLGRVGSSLDRCLGMPRTDGAWPHLQAETQATELIEAIGKLTIIA